MCNGHQYKSGTTYNKIYILIISITRLAVLCYHISVLILNILDIPIRRFSGIELRTISMLKSSMELCLDFILKLQNTVKSNKNMLSFA